MNNDTINFIQTLHAAPRQAVLAMTGGGSGAIGQLLAVPGGSRTVLEAVVPYSSAALVDFLRATPERFCCEQTARLMAMAAWQRAKKLELNNEVVGVGCTASLASDRPKRGPHRLHVAVQTAAFTSVHSLELKKDRRPRMEEEDAASTTILNAVAEGFDVAARLPLPLLAGEEVQSRRLDAPPEWRDLLTGHVPITLRVMKPHAERKEVSSASQIADPPLVFPGAFNPLHNGHRQMAAIAQRRLNRPVTFEISVVNVDKPPLDFIEMETRAAQFTKEGRALCFTRAATFEEKSRLFPGGTFVVGIDTLTRIAQAKYAGGTAEQLRGVIETIALRGCKFLVFGREVNGKFQTLADIPLPQTLREICEEVPAAEFRADVSSTELRQM